MLLELLEEAQADPNGDAARTVLLKVLRFINLSGRSVPWGNGERKAEITKLMVHFRCSGPASHFLTLAPEDDDELETWSSSEYKA